MDIGTIYLISLSIISGCVAFCTCYKIFSDARVEKQKLACELAIIYLQVMGIQENTP